MSEFTPLIERPLTERKQKIVNSNYRGYDCLHVSLTKTPSGKIVTILDDTSEMYIQEVPRPGENDPTYVLTLLFKPWNQAGLAQGIDREFLKNASELHSHLSRNYGIEIDHKRWRIVK